jgi:hypothetical protein
VTCAFVKRIIFIFRYMLCCFPNISCIHVVTTKAVILNFIYRFQDIKAPHIGGRNWHRNNVTNEIFRA